MFSCSWDSRIAEKASNEEGGEHAMGVDCQALRDEEKIREINAEQLTISCY